MPTAALRPCPYSGCRSLVRKGPCANHQGRKEWSTAGVSRQARGYGAAWERTRREVMVEEPVCRICGQRPSAMVDHIVPKAEGGTDERSNLRGVCKRCHQVKSAREGARGRRRRTGAA
jgi:5-methylcytosine-specific restriction enzyme A